MTSSYSNILDEIENNVIDGPQIAIGMRKPGELTGVWLFGEEHVKEVIAENDGIENFQPFHEMVQKYNENTVMLFEGPLYGMVYLLGLPGDSLKNVVRSILVGDKNDSLKPYIIPYDYKGRKEVTDEKDIKETSPYETFKMEKEEPQLWSDEEYLEFMYESYIAKSAFKFASKGGTTINYEDKIRYFFINVLSDGTGHEDISINGNAFMYIIHRAIERRLPVSVAINEEHDSYTNDKSLLSDEGYYLMTIIVKYVNFMYEETITPYFREHVLKQIQRGIQFGDNPLEPRFLDSPEEQRKMATALVLILMDFKIIGHMDNHPGKNFIVFTGTHHTIANMRILMDRGYIIEHTFVNDKKSYISGRNRVENMPESVDNYDPMKYIEDVETVLEF